MVTKWGMGRDPEADRRRRSPAAAPSRSSSRPRDRSLPTEIQAAATRAIRAILDEAYAEASRTLIDHLETLRRLAAYLVEHERVDGATFDALFDGRLPVPTSADEWRAATARPRAWGDVVDLAGHRHRGAASTRGRGSVPVVAAAIAAPSPTATAPGAGELTTSVAPPDAAPVVTASALPATSAAAILSARPRAGLRRSTRRHARSLAAGVLSRAERWLRSGEPESDRL